MISKNTDTKSKNGYIKEFFKLHKHLTDSGDSIPIVEYKVNYNKHGKAIQEPCMISKHKLYEHVINHPEQSYHEVFANKHVNATYRFFLDIDQKITENNIIDIDDIINNVYDVLSPICSKSGWKCKLMYIKCSSQ